MKKKMVMGLAIGLFLFGIEGFAGSTNLTFDTLPADPGGGISVSNPFIEQGFLITPLVGSSLAAYGDGWQNNRGSSNGTTYVGLFNASWNGGIEVKATDNSLISIKSIDLGELLNQGDPYFDLIATNITFTGYKDGGTEISASFAMDTISDGSGQATDFQTHLFGSSWTGLTYITINAINGDGGVSAGGPYVYFAFDNIVLNETTNPVPEPATMVLIGSGLIGLAGVRKKFKK